MLLVRSDPIEVIAVERLLQGRNNMTRSEAEPRSCDGHGANLNLNALFRT